MKRRYAGEHRARDTWAARALNRAINGRKDTNSAYLNSMYRHVA